MESISITVTRRSGDYKAWITGKSGCWDCGDNPDKAIEELKRTYPECQDCTLAYYKIN